MPAMTVRNISDEAHRALKQRAKNHGVSAEAEMRSILEDTVLPKDRIKLGTWLYEKSRSFGGVELDITRDPSSIEAADFE